MPLDNNERERERERQRRDAVFTIKRRREASQRAEEAGDDGSIRLCFLIIVSSSRLYRVLSSNIWRPQLFMTLTPFLFLHHHLQVVVLELVLNARTGNFYGGAVAGGVFGVLGAGFQRLDEEFLWRICRRRCMELVFSRRTRRIRRRWWLFGGMMVAKFEWETRVRPKGSHLAAELI
ncbi:hypothetical protein ACLOJK_033770 [Asimina triloba]